MPWRVRDASWEETIPEDCNAKTTEGEAVDKTLSPRTDTLNIIGQEAGEVAVQNWKPIFHT